MKKTGAVNKERFEPSTERENGATQHTACAPQRSEDVHVNMKNAQWSARSDRRL
jgi:hypothetical protein